MNKYLLTINYKDGSTKYDMTSATNETIEEVQNRYNALVKNGLHSFKNVKNVVVDK